MNARVEETRKIAQQAFADDVNAGLSSRPKRLPCKWFYDAAGSALFEQITATLEYYPTRVETRLLRESLPALIECCGDVEVLIEPGSGSSAKSRLLLESLPRLRRYLPIDISAEFLLDNAAALRSAYPALHVEPLIADFTALNKSFALPTQQQPLVFFPGSTIGNFAPEEAVKLLTGIRRAAGARARLLIGVDMTQDAAKLEAAYNDAAGITARFNRNLLLRANRELDTDFEVPYFRHHAYFNAREWRVEMHLVSERPQQVRLGDNVFEFVQGESIHTENSYKYALPDFTELLASAGWSITRTWLDHEESSFGVLLLHAE